MKMTTAPVLNGLRCAACTAQQVVSIEAAREVEPTAMREQTGPPVSGYFRVRCGGCQMTGPIGATAEIAESRWLGIGPYDRDRGRKIKTVHAIASKAIEQRNRATSRATAAEAEVASLKRLLAEARAVAPHAINREVATA